MIRIILLACILYPLCLSSQTVLHYTDRQDMSKARAVPGERFKFDQLKAHHDYLINISPNYPFSCLGLGWKIKEALFSPQQLTFSYRTRSESGEWTEWITADADFTPKETPTGMYWTDLLFTHDATNHVAIEIRVQQPVETESLVLDLFDGNVDPHPNHGLLPHENLGTQERGGCPEFPAIIPRSSWCGGSAPCADVNSPYSVSYISPTHVVMHHGASPNTYTDGQAVVRSYWNYHVNTLGWIDIGYNYIIDKYGNFYQGRHNPSLPNTDVRGAHAGNANNGSIGMNFLGNLDVSIATTVQLQKLYEVLGWWFHHKSYDPLGSAGMQTQSHGWQVQPRFTTHNAIGTTACPGTDMISRMPSIRLEIKAVIDACTTPPDNDPPSTAIEVPYSWRNHDFWAHYNDEDPPGGTGVQDAFYQVLDFNGVEWRANQTQGFFNDNFDSAIHPDWIDADGNWSIQTGHIRQSDQANGNSNIYTAHTQNNQQSYLYQWSMNIGGTGTNRRAGLHFFVDNPVLPNRGNAYLAWYRADDNKFQFYRVTNDVLNLVVDNTVNVPDNQWIDCKIIYHPTSGLIEAYLDNQLVGTYVDPSPLTTGAYISLRNGDADVLFDDLKVRKSRSTETLITVGPQAPNDVRFESLNPSQDACRINTIVKDGAGNWSPQQAKQIYIDWTLPTTTSTVATNWQTDDFSVSFVDEDNTNGSGLARRFYQVIDFDGTDWRANQQQGFFSDNFDLPIHPDWTVVNGNWTTTNNVLEQTDESNSNTNIFAELNQQLSNRYLYNFQMNIDGTGNNRRGGFHYFCDQPNLTNRGNSYFVWFRVDLQTLEFFKVTNDTFSQEKVIPLITQPGVWYDINVVYDRITGETFVYRDGKLVGDWKDTNPILYGDFISFRSGNSHLSINNLKVYRTRNANVNVTVGSPTDDIRFQNPDPFTFAAKVKSIVADTAHNLSAVHYHDLNIDWSPPSDVAVIDGLGGIDIDVFFTSTEISANWTTSSDAHSDILKYWMAVGTTPGSNDVLGWTDVGLTNAYTATGLNMANQQMYYVSIQAENGAGLLSNPTTSDGQLLDNPNQPVANFNAATTLICAGDSIVFNNTSTNATSYSWSFQGGSPASSNLTNPSTLFTTSGSYDITLTATGAMGVDVLTQTIQVQVQQPPIAQLSPSSTAVNLPNAIVFFTNQSQDADTYLWDFGNGITSTEDDPWVQYTATGSYQVMLVASIQGCPADTAFVTIHVGVSSTQDLTGALSVEIFPNPVQEFATITLNLPENSALGWTLVDVAGRTVAQHQVHGNHVGIVSFDVPVRSLSAGAYFIQVMINDVPHTLQFIKK